MRFYRGLIAMLVAIAIVASCHLIFNHIRESSSQKSRLQLCARDDLRQIEISCEVLAGNTPQIFLNLAKISTNSTQFYKFLCNRRNDRNQLLLEDRPRWRKKGAFVDLQGAPYDIRLNKVIATNGSFVFSFEGWSSGDLLIKQEIKGVLATR